MLPGTADVIWPTGAPLVLHGATLAEHQQSSQYILLCGLHQLTTDVNCCPSRLQAQAMIQAGTDEAAKLRAQLTLANDREDQVTGTLQELQLQYSQVRTRLCSPSMDTPCNHCCDLHLGDYFRC